MPADGVDKKCHSDILSLEDHFNIVKESISLGITKVRITGGEPLVRRGIIELVRKISSLEEIKDLAMTTNGSLLRENAKALKEAGLDRVNISIDTLNHIKFNQITRGGNLTDVLEGIKEAKRVGLVPIKLNVVVINGFNTDEVRDFIRLADDDVEVRFIELMPIGEAANWNKSKFISNSELIEEHSDLLADDLVESSGPAKCYRRRGSEAKIGFINPISSHFCDKCNRVRVTPDGMLKTCLHSNEEVDLKEVLQLEEYELRELIAKSIKNKPEKHHLNDEDFIPIIRSMNRIGG
jgi:cyclic pyranopterin phosphate synthase